MPQKNNPKYNSKVGPIPDEHFDGDPVTTGDPRKRMNEADRAAFEKMVDAIGDPPQQKEGDKR